MFAGALSAKPLLCLRKETSHCFPLTQAGCKVSGKVLLKELGLQGCVASGSVRAANVGLEGGSWVLIPLYCKIGQ